MSRESAAQMLQDGTQSIRDDLEVLFAGASRSERVGAMVCALSRLSTLQINSGNRYGAPVLANLLFVEVLVLEAVANTLIGDLAGTDGAAEVGHGLCPAVLGIMGRLPDLIDSASQELSS